MVQDRPADDGPAWATVVTGGDWDGEVRLAELSVAPPGISTPLLMGESWPVWAKPTAVEDTGTEVESVGSDRSQGEGKPTDWMSSESMLSESIVRLSDHDRSPSSDTTGRERSMARQ
jgi:hypothetical protein